MKHPELFDENITSDAEFNILSILMNLNSFVFICREEEGEGFIFLSLYCRNSGQQYDDQLEWRLIESNRGSPHFRGIWDSEGWLVGTLGESQNNYWREWSVIYTKSWNW